MARASSQYRPLSDYALIGDGHTAALVSGQGSIDWLCAPSFDSPSVFASLLDARRGGYFAIRPVGGFESEMSYIGHSAAVKNRFRTASGAVELIDFMPVSREEGDEPFGTPGAERRVVRLLEGIEGEMELALDYFPRPQYGAPLSTLKQDEGGISVEVGGGEALTLRSSIPLTARDDRAEARWIVQAGQRAALVLELTSEAVRPAYSDVESAVQALRATLEFWRNWHDRCRYEGPYYSAVMRSLITLKLLTYSPTGAMVAAPTTSLPEEVGGVRNWDYRYTWIRDASLASRALLDAGHAEDAQRFMKWVCEMALHCRPGELQIMYGLRGERDLQERSLEHLEGYLGSRPVRVGNDASKQFQLDVYGELLECFDVVRQANQLPVVDAKDMWPAFRGQVDVVAARWREPDSGIWEVRNDPRHFVHSKVLAWVALDRGIRAVEQAGLPADLPRWRRERDAIRNEVMTRGYDARLGSFVQSYGSTLPDAANLLLSIVGFIDASHPCMRSTIELIERRLLVDGLVYRYRETDDGLPGRDATFAVCTFWLVENLVALGRLREARELFEGMLARATPLGLFAEEIDPQSGAHLGNFPQALTHLGLVNAAVALSRQRPQV